MHCDSYIRQNVCINSIDCDYNMNKLLTAAIAMVLLTACGGLSNKAKKIVGNYYNTSVSDNVPIFELNRDGSCVARAIRPEVLTISVKGTWNVVDDTLIIHNNLETITADGDTSLIGTVSPEYKAFVAGYTDRSLTLQRDGVEYEFVKRVAAADNQ